MNDDTQIRWPSSTDYTQAVQQPAMAFAAAHLRVGTITTTPLGMPAVASGQNVVVFRVETEQGALAVRCFINAPGQGELRYAALVRHLEQNTCAAMSTASWMDEGVRTHDRWWPIVVMPWEDGRPLNVVVEDHLDSPDDLRALAQNWKHAVEQLQTATIAHGDLQHGNVLVDKDMSVTFVDLDGVWVPSLLVGAPAENGHPNYQHPARSSQHWGQHVDSFSALLILVSLLALAADPRLERHMGGENLLFRRDDLEKPGLTPVWSELSASPDPHVRDLTARLLAASRAATPPLVPFGQLLSGGVPDSIGYVVSQEEGETVARRSVVPLRDPAPATDEAWWTPEGSASSIGAPVETAALVAHARPAPSSGGRGIGRFAARNVVVSGALGGAAAGLVGSVAQGAVAASLGQEMQVVVFVGLVCGLLGLVMNGWQPVVVRGVRGGIGPAVIGLMMGAAAGVVGLGYADFIADSMFEVDQVRAPQVLALVWMLVAAFVGMTIGILSSFRAAFAGLFGGAIGGAIGGALHGSTTAQLVRGGLILDGVDPATVAVTMAVGCIIGISVGSVTRALRRASLTVIEGRLQGVEVLIKKSSATIGCSSKSTLVIASTADATVMPKHATIRLVDGGIGEIELHASASIDGVSVEGISPLVSGAVIRIGESFIRYERRV